jgi:hypothetical protein
MQSPTKPVEDSVPKVNNEIAVGTDLEFQRRWWRFEKGVWILFALIVVLDLLGCFGRGYLAKAQARTQNGMMDVHYERIERLTAPSMLTIQFGQNAIHDGKVELWASESLVKALGNQRIIPQPTSSVLGQGGIFYTFPATAIPVSIQFALEPASIGPTRLQLRIPGSDEFMAKIFVMP